MPGASYAVESFLGGEISQFAQGAFSKPSYKISLNVCLNAFPVEAGTWTPRPGTAYAGHSRGGAPALVSAWEFDQATPYTLEFTDLYLRFRAGSQLITNPAVAVSAISTADPAVVTCVTSPPTGATVMFGGLGTSCPLLQNRQFTWTNLTDTTGSIADALTGASIDGSTLGVSGLAGTATLLQIYELPTVYNAGSWKTVQVIQAADTGICVNGSTAPQALVVASDPTATAAATFTFDPAIFEDGPYLDPFTNGVIATPNALSGIVTMTLSFPAYSSTTSYAKGDFVTANSNNYESLADQNVGNSPNFNLTTNNSTAAGNAVLHVASTAGIVVGMTATDTTAAVIPANTTVLSFVANTSITLSKNVTGAGVGNGDTINFTSPAFWQAVSAGAAINDGQGFLGTDVGRLIRFLSEPAAWLAGSIYSTGAVISYNPTGQPGASTYWQSLTSSNTGNVPGTDLTHWELVQPGAALPAILVGSNFVTSPAAASGPMQWSWGKIVGLSNFIEGDVADVVHVGSMTEGGGNAAAFNGTASQNAASSAALITSLFDPILGNNTLNSYVGQNYTSGSPSAYAVDHVAVFPPTDIGFVELFISEPGVNAVGTLSCTFTLYASNSAPTGFNDGTALGSATINLAGVFGYGISALGSSPIIIPSSDKVTQYSYWWVAMETNFNMNSLSGFAEIQLANYASQVQFFNAVSSGSSAAAVNVEILGPPLLYETGIVTWRLGAYSDTTGWPTTGTYAGGRLWLGGVIPGRFDASTTDDITDGTVNFAPTDQYGGVNDNNGISYTLKAEGTDPILWFKAVVQNQALRGIIIGTQGREFFLFPPSAGPITATNIDDVRVTKNGCAAVLPVETEHTFVFVQRYSVKLLEYFSDVFSGKFTAPNLAQDAQHIPRAGIAQLAYTHATTPIIWGRCNDGTLFGITYKRDTLMTASGPTYKAWHRHQLGSGRTVESICAGPSVGGNLDALTMVTEDASTTIRHVEVLTDQLDELATLAQSWFLDDGIVPTSTVSTNVAQTGAPYGGLTLNGLWPHNGKTISVFAGGLDCGDYTVSNGSVFVPYGDGVAAGTGGGLFTAAFVASIPASQIIAGFTYNSDGQLVRPQMPPETGARNGPALGKRRRVHKVSMLLNNLAMGNVRNQSALSVGRDFNHLQPVIISPEVVPNAPRMTPGQVFSGVWKDTISDEDGYDGMVCWRISRPLPGNIIAIQSFIETQDE